MGGYTLVLLVAVVVIAIVVVEYFVSRRRSKAPAPSLNISGAWEFYRGNPEKFTSRDCRAISAMEAVLGTESIRQLEDSLETLGEEIERDPKPLVALRTAIMDATDEFVLSEAISAVISGPEETGSLSPDHVRSILTVGALRSFAWQKYNDFASSDWYAHYLSLAEMNARNVSQMIEKTTQGSMAAFETRLHDPLSRSMFEARKALLDYPPRTPVLQAVNLRADAPPPLDTLSENEVERLSSFMKERFEKLLTGQIYRWPSGPTVDPKGALAMDAALLYAVLALRYPEPRDGWRKILHSALGDHRDLVQESDELIAMGRDFHSLWVTQKNSGPLTEILKRGYPLVFPTDGLATAEGYPSASIRMMSDDAMSLVREVKRITGQH